jgi:predicted glutamine amidotransferase
MTLRQVLGEAAAARFSKLSSVHADGWGAAWYDQYGRRQVWHSTAQASRDVEFARFARETATTTCFVHLRRGTPGYGLGTRNTHPFADGQWAFGHNGAITPKARIDRLVEHTARRPGGTTDSERYFLALRAELDVTCGGVAEAITQVRGRIQAAGLAASSLNAMLVDPGTLHVISSHDPNRPASAAALWPADELASGTAPPYFSLFYRTGPDLVAAVSSGVVKDQPGWRSIPNHSVLGVDRTTRTIQITGSPADLSRCPPFRRTGFGA